MDKRKHGGRLFALEEQTATRAAISAIVTDTQAPRPRPEIRGLLMDLLVAKLEASRAVADAARAAMASPAWLSRQSAEGVATLADYLDRSAFALGDRLAGSAQEVRRDEP